MAKLVYALFDDEGAAEAAASELSQNNDEHPSLPSQTHRQKPLDGNILPECGTDVGRNTLIASTVGGGVFAVIGGVAGGIFDLPGLRADLGAMIGLLTGILLGVLGGMMAGTRLPKKPVRELAERLGEGKVLVTSEVQERHFLDAALEVLARHGGDDVGSC